MICYLDWAAAAPPLKETLAVYQSVSESHPGNPSSLHQHGKAAAGILEFSRKRCAELLAVPPGTLLFTSGGTESNSLVHAGLLRNRRRGTVIISGIEHPSIHGYGSIYRDLGFKVVTIDAPGGCLNLDAFRLALSEEVRLVSFMLVCNVTGTVQPLIEAIEAVRAAERNFGHSIHFHTDAVQALGKVPVSLSQLGVDSASFSFHKFGGVKGVGMLYLRKPVPLVIAGGGQERGFRPGTEAVPAIAAGTEALEKALATLNESRNKAEALQARLEVSLTRNPGRYRILGGRDNPRNIATVPQITCFSCRGIPSELMVRILDARGFSISAGSACSSSDRKKRERVLRAMGYDDRDASSALRVSTGPATSLEEIEAFCLALDQEAEIHLKATHRRIVTTP